MSHEKSPNDFDVQPWVPWLGFPAWGAAVARGKMTTRVLMKLYILVNLLGLERVMKVYEDSKMKTV